MVSGFTRIKVIDKVYVRIFQNLIKKPLRDPTILTRVSHPRLTKDDDGDDEDTIEALEIEENLNANASVIDCGDSHVTCPGNVCCPAESTCCLISNDNEYGCCGWADVSG